MAEASESAKTFSFDAVFSDKTSQKAIYDVCAAPVVQSVLEGYNGTIFCYGQTGAGKVSMRCILIAVVEQTVVSVLSPFR